MTAGNQQERPSDLASSTQIPVELGSYLAGFTDGEGSFNVSFRKRNDYLVPWKASVSFNISQRDDSMCRMFQQALGCGTIRYRKDGVCYFEVTDLRDFLEIVVPFFRRFPLLSKKRFDFEALTKIARMMESGDHLTSEGFRRIVEIRRPMNNGGKRKYTEEEILSSLHPMESSEAIRQAPWSGTQG